MDREKKNFFQKRDEMCEDLHTKTINGCDLCPLGNSRCTEFTDHNQFIVKNYFDRNSNIKNSCEEEIPKMLNGSIRIVLTDERENEFNQSLDMEKELYYSEDDDTISVEAFRDFCITFIRAIGFHDSTIKEYFGEF